MLEALIHGKLSREEEDTEDLLTSTVFGMLKYLPIDVGLLPFLRLARAPGKEHDIDEYFKDVTTVDWDFWPQFAHPSCLGCEPDISLTLEHSDGSRSWILIEAKYKSGKSSNPSTEETVPTDQLAREYDNLNYLACEQGFQRFALIYLTAHYAPPKTEIEESRQEYLAKRGYYPRIFWLSWRLLGDALSRADEYSPIASDLIYLCDRLGLTLYRRLRYGALLPVSWSFKRSFREWSWEAESPFWHFRKRKQAWAWAVTPATWSFRTKEIPEIH